MKKYVVSIYLGLFVFCSSAHAEDKHPQESTSTLQTAGVVITAIGLLGVAAKDSGGSSAAYEAKKASPIIVLAGLTMFAIGKNQETKLGLSYNQSQPVLAFSHKF